MSSGAALARQVEHAFSTRELRNPRLDGEGDYRFLCTGDVDSFRELGTRFLQMPLGVVEHVELAGRRGGRVSRAGARSPSAVRRGGSA